MARFHATRIEQIFEKCPDLKREVEAFLDARFGFPHYNRELMDLIFKATGESLASSTVSSWVQRRYRDRSWPEVRKRIQEKKEAYAAMADLVGERGLDDAAKANLWRVVELMTPEQLLALRRFQLDIKRLTLAEKQLESKNRELEMKLAATKEAIEEAGNKLGKGESLTSEDISRIRERVFGSAA